MLKLSSLKSAIFNSTAQLNWYSCIDSDFYESWIEEESIRLAQESLSYQERFFSGDPFFSIVVPLFNTHPDFLKAMIDSVMAQSFQSWELLLINASAGNDDILTIINTYSDKRVKHITLGENYGIAGNTNVGIDKATGKFVCFLDHDDVLSPRTLATYYKYLDINPTADVLYCDEDLINESGDYVAAHFKGSFNIDLLRCHNYITHFLAVKSSLAKDLKLESTFDGAQDYDFVLRLSERTSEFVHVPYVLYHWRAHDGSTAANIDSKEYAEEAGRKALQAHADRLALNATACKTSSRCVYNLDYELQDFPKVALIIYGTNRRRLKRSAKSIIATTDYPAELLTVFTSSELNSKGLISKELERGQYEYCILISENIQKPTKDWIKSMLSVCQRTDVGIVGARIKHKDGRLFHAGLALSPNTISNNKVFERPFENSEANDGGYFERAIVRQRVTAVDTCIMTTTSLLERTVGVENFLEQLRFANSYEASLLALDFCLKSQAEGFSVIYEPRAEMIIDTPLTSRTNNRLFGNSRRTSLIESSFKDNWDNELQQGDLFFGKAFLKAAFSL